MSNTVEIAVKIVKMKHRIIDWLKVNCARFWQFWRDLVPFTDFFFAKSRNLILAIYPRSIFAKLNSRENKQQWSICRLRLTEPEANSKARPRYAGAFWKWSFVSPVEASVHTNPSRKRSVTKALWPVMEEFENTGFPLLWEQKTF